jgi:hypothetical protein
MLFNLPRLQGLGNKDSAAVVVVALDELVYVEARGSETGK